MHKHYKKLSLGLVFFFLFVFSLVSEAVEVDRLIIYPEDNSQNARHEIIDELAKAQESIQMSAYQMKDQGIADTLIECQKRGVNVSLILEEEPYKHSFNKDDSQTQLLPKLLDVNIKIYGRPSYLKDQYPSGHYHARYIIIDNKRFLLTTGNFDESTFDHCRDFAVVFNKEASPVDFEVLQDIFVKDTQNLPLESASPFVIVGPENQRDKIIAFLNTAQKTIKLYQQYFNDPQVLEALKNLIEKKGIKVELLMMPYPTGYNKKDPNIETQDVLKALGVDVRLMLSLYGHARAIIIDEKEVLVGTTQLSPPSLDENREISMVIKGPVVDRLIRKFKEDQETAVSLKEGRKIALEKKIDWNEVKLLQ